MEFFSKVNAKLDQGWKYSDCECPECKKPAMFNTKAETFHCLQCEKTLHFERVQPEEQPSPSKIQTLENPVRKREKDQTSGKLAEKLLEGWTMLEECCPDCLVPLMRPKKGAAVCVSCGFEWDKTKTKKPEPQAERIENQELLSKEERKKEKEIRDRNLDKPRPVSEFPKKGQTDVIAVKQEALMESFNGILMGVGRIYKEKGEKISNDGNFEAAEAFIKGPVAEFLEVQRRFLENCLKIKEMK